MKPFLRFLAAIVFLLLIAAGVIYHLGGKQMEFKAETTIQSTTVKNVMDHLSKPELVEKWAAGLEALEPGSKGEPKIAKSDSRSGDTQAIATFKDDAGEVEMTNQRLFASDDSLTVRTTNEHSDTFSTWQMEQQGDDVVVRQLMLGVHKGLGRFEGLFRKQEAQATMQSDLDRLKSFIETGKLPEDAAENAKANESESNTPSENKGGESPQQRSESDSSDDKAADHKSADDKAVDATPI